MKDRYSLFTPYYSFLANLIFGQRLFKAKRYFVHEVSSKNILIIGGGDGTDYRDLSEQLTGEYWELSDSMLAKAKNNLASSKLLFQLGDFCAKEKQYDEVWLHFVLDTIPDQELEKLMREIKKALKPEGLINFVDFFPPKKRLHRVLQFLQITYFKLVAKHRRNDLPDYEKLFNSFNFLKNKEKSWMHSWVKTQVWKNA